MLARSDEVFVKARQIRRHRMLIAGPHFAPAGLLERIQFESGVCLNGNLNCEYGMQRLASL
tara:strand:+ start:57 stop:239 length:183 start_codon:yes stop_codon:yes gene_type:complete